jgi:molybdopterin biosynthesis enzyme
MVLEIPQRITRLTPIAEALARIDARISSVAPREIDVTNAIARTLAEDVAVGTPMPPKPIALRDGWATHSDLTHDASSYAPALLAKPPIRIDAGEILPTDTDAVASFDAVVVRDGRAEIVCSVAPGEGVLPAAADAVALRPLRRAGERVRATDAAVFAALGITRLQVREPRVRLVHAGAHRDIVEATVALVTKATQSSGAVVINDKPRAGGDDLDAALRCDDDDAIIAIGGTGSGRADASVQTLLRAGKLEFHGVGLMPGETSAFGHAGKRPVLLLPGRLDAALAGWLMLGRRLLARLSGSAADDLSITAELSCKIASTVGIAEIVPVRLSGVRAEPLAANILPLQTLARADGFVLIPAESEGYPAGAAVAVRALP